MQVRFQIICKAAEMQIYSGKQLTARTTLSNGQFVLQTDAEAIMAINWLTDIVVWHHRLGHINYPDLKRLHAKGMVTGMHLDTNSPAYATPPYCQDCVAGKMAC